MTTTSSRTGSSWREAAPGQYEEVKELADLDNLIDYVLENIYFGNDDWDRNNSVALRRREPPGRFRFVVWDAEFAISLPPGRQPNEWPPILLRNRTSVNNDGAPSGIFQGLRRNPEFRVLLADHIHELFFNGGLFTPERLTEAWMRRARQVHGPVVGESARWGDYRRDVFSRRDPPRDFPLLTRNGPYLEHQRWILEEYFPARTEIVVGQLRAAGYYPDLEPPALGRYRGTVPQGFRLDISATRGVLYYTGDGSDPRLPGGEVSPKAIAAGDASFRPILAAGAEARVLVPADGDLGLEWVRPEFDDATWARGPTGVGYERTSGYERLLGTDLAAELDGVNASVYVRVPFDLAEVPAFDFLTLRMKYDDGFIAYLNGELVAGRNAPEDARWDSTATRGHPDGRAVVFEDIDITGRRDLLRRGRNVLAIHGLNRRAGDSDMLILPELAVSSAAAAEVVIGRTTEIRARVLSGGEWSPLSRALLRVDSGLRISEIMYHPLGPRAFEIEAGFDDQDDFEFIELLNAGDGPIELGGRRLAGGVRLAFDALQLAPGERVVAVSDPAAFELRYDATGIRIAGEYEGHLANGGETIVLTGAAGIEEIRIDYDDRWYPETDGDGRSLVLADLDAADLGDAGAWRPSRAILGSPGSPE